MAPSTTVQAEQTGSSAMVERVIRHIDRMIGKGLLIPGSAISEPALIAELQIGRVPVREAIRILAGEGLLELVPNRSARLRAVNATEILEMLDVLVCFSAAAINVLSIKPIVPQIANELLASGDEIVRLAKCGAHSQEILHEINRFHYLLIRASSNGYMLRLLKKTRMHFYSKSLVALLGRRAFLDSAAGYAKLAAAVVRGDAQGATRLLFNNVATAKSYAKIDE